MPCTTLKYGVHRSPNFAVYHFQQQLTLGCYITEFRKASGMILHTKTIPRCCLHHHYLISYSVSAHPLKLPTFISLIDTYEDAIHRRSLHIIVLLSAL